MYLPANPTARRREEALLMRARLEALDAKLNLALAMVRMEVGATAPAFPTEDDIAEVGVLLVEGKVRLPRYATVNVETEIEERKDSIFGNSTIYHHRADQLCVHALQPMSIPAAIEAGLLVKLGGNWLWNEATYRCLVPSDPRLRT
jgi:hypothetical protein